MKKIINVLLSAAMVFSMFAFFGVRSAAETSGYFTYSETESEVTITGYTGTEIDIVIPGIINGKPITAIDSNAFSNKSFIQTVQFPDTVKTVGSQSFSSCTSLKELVLPRDLEHIENGAFMQCNSLYRITFNEKLKTIGRVSFMMCKKLTSLYFPETLTAIGDAAFGSCIGLQFVRWPHSLTDVASNALISSKGLIIVGCAGSYAKTYAEDNAAKGFVFAEVACSNHLFVKGECSCCHVLLGDLNGDGQRTTEDLDLLTSYVDGTAECPDLELADMNQDKVLDVYDENLLMRLLLGQDIWA